MKTKFIPILFISLFISCTTKQEDIPVMEKDINTETQSIQGSAIVEFSDEMATMIESSLSNGSLATKSSDLNEILDMIGVTSIERQFPDAGEWEARHREAGLHRWYKITYDPKTSITKAEDGFLGVPGVVSVETPRKKTSSSYFNDPNAQYQWGLYNNGSLGNSFKVGSDINVTEVWKNYTAGNNNVIVAVIDGGVQLNHDDLSAITIKENGNGSRTFISDKATITPDNHGTHVAGIIGAINNNNTGVMGVAGGYDGNGGVRIMSCEIMADDPNDPKNSLNGDEARALVWAADHGAVIANNSWEYLFDSESEAQSFNLPRSIKNAIDYFITYAGIDANGKQTGPMKGGVVFFAAGNKSWKIGHPASYEKVIAVGAIGPNYARTSYTNYGDWVDICAPGGEPINYGSIISTITQNKYGYMNGTSMACPFVSGVAALLVSYFGKEGFTNNDLIKRLLAGANTHAVSPQSKIGGLVDAYGSFLSGSSIAPDPVEDFTVTSKSNSIIFDWKVTADKDDKKAAGYIVVAGENKNDVDQYDGSQSNAKVVTETVTTNNMKLGDKLQTSIRGLGFSQKYYTKIIAFDYSQNLTSSAIKEVNTGENNPPVITCSSNEKMHYIKATFSLVLDFKVSDPDGHNVSASYSNATNGESFGMRGETYTLRIDGLHIKPGTYTSTLKATDQYGMSSSYDIHFTILENHSPVIKKEMDNILIVGRNAKYTIDLNQYFNDPDNDYLTASVSYSNERVISATQNGSELTFESIAFGRTDCEITVQDALGKSVSQKITIVVRQEGSEIEFFPNPVKDFLNISTGKDIETSEVTITSETGKVFYSGTQTSSAFTPAKIDMSSFQSGLYRINVKFSNREYNSTITKSN